MNHSSSVPLELLPKIAGYSILEQLYFGPRTVVYRAVEDSQKQPVVVKILRSEYPNFNELIQFRNQYATAKNLDIPGIVHPLKLEAIGNRDALIMEDFGGIALGEYLQQQPITLTEILEVAIQIADILHGLYQNRVVHKDIKPANILIHPQTKQIKLIDFSIASLLPKETQEIQNPNILEGTLAYLAPEQTGRMNRGIDYRADFYALGVTLYQLLTRRLPFISNDALELIHCHIAKVPLPVSHLNTEIPAIVGAIVAKLMAKNAEDRYQSALGLKHDLEQCRQQWQEKGKIAEFKLGQQDISDRFLIPEKLYGREGEIQALLKAFDRVAAGSSELILVAGFSGIGKTALINEVHKPIVRQRGYFIKGKFDQFNRNIPLSAFVRALRDLMAQLRSESDTQLAQWQQKILAAVGDNGQILIDVIPELEGIIGQQPAATELLGNAAQNRFNLLFQKFIEVFATPEHPLVLFLDDLQWADSDSLQLLKLLTSDQTYLLILGAYRDNEVSPVHPLMLTVEELKKTNGNIQTITLAPLTVEDTNTLIAESLNCSLELAAPLTELVEKKTKGNPFFTTQFLKALYEDGYIYFYRTPELNHGYWECDITQITELSLTDDVVEFMALQLQKLPLKTQNVLKFAACIGNSFDLETLAIVSEQSLAETAVALWKALQEGFILPIGQIYKFFQGAPTKDTQRSVNPQYRFLHDRVQQSAYSLIPESQTAIFHYQIGELLLQKISPEKQEERIFELVNQLNYGKDLVAEQSQRDHLAELNLIATKKARSSVAYEAGREYAKIGLELLKEEAWQRQYKLCLKFHELATELALLCGDFEATECLANCVIENAHTLLEQIGVYETKIQSYITQNQLKKAVDTGLKVLARLNLTLPEMPTQEDIGMAFYATKAAIGNRKIEELSDLPAMSDPEKIAMSQILSSILSCAFVETPALFPILVTASVRTSLEYGNVGSSANGYICYAMIASSILHEVETSVTFGQVALNLVSKFDAKTTKPEILCGIGGFTHHRQFHMEETLSYLQEGYTTALEYGNLEFAGHSAHVFCVNFLLCAPSLQSIEEKSRAFADELRQLKFFTCANHCQICSRFALNLLGDKQVKTSTDSVVQESEIFANLQATSDSRGFILYYFCQLLWNYSFEDFTAASESAADVLQHFSTGTGTTVEPTFYFYDSLILLAEMSEEVEATRAEKLERIEINQAKLQQVWAKYAPMNYQHKWDLVEAEKYRIFGQFYQAADYYDRAIAGAKKNRFVSEEALANELAAKFYLGRGRETLAANYMQAAYYSYTCWGAKAKVQDLEERYPQLLIPILQQRASGKISETLAIKTFQTLPSQSSLSSKTSVSTALDFATVLKVSQTLSGEIELDKLLATLLSAVLENAGADRGVLLLPRGEQWFVEAIATLDLPPRVESISLAQSTDVPQTLIAQVKRSQEDVIVADAAVYPQFLTDAYFGQKQPKSILCTPIFQQGKLTAILYLENNVTVGAFTEDRVELLNLLCTQAAISLENARLYKQAQNYAQQLEQSQLQIVQSEKMATLGNLVAGVAHEINNPIGFLNGSIEHGKNYTRRILEHLALYQQYYPEPATEIIDNEEDIDLEFIEKDLPKLFSSMQGAIERIKSISNSLRTFSRADTEKPVLADIHEGLDSTLLILKYRLKANERRPAIQIFKNYGNLPQIECFSGQLNQVFMNILANAVDVFDEVLSESSYAELEANPQQITIKTEVVENNTVAIHFADNGKGMSEEVKSRIFDHLFTTKGVGKGTGLGLAIARQIVVEKHHGSIEVHSELGSGTEFLIYLPVGLSTLNLS